MQKRTFHERIANSKKKLDEVKTIKYAEENLLGGRGEGDEGRRWGKVEEYDENDYNEMKDTAGVKIIRFEEDIRKVFCSRNTS